MQPARGLHPARPKRINRRLSGTTLIVILAMALGGCVLPAAPAAYPYWGPYGSRLGVINEANRQSGALEQYVKGVLDGRNPAVIPANLLPVGLDATLKGQPWTVQRESEIDPTKQWVVRERAPINFASATGSYADQHATYLLLPHFLPPFGSKVLMDGKFPHARFFDIQATPSFQPEQYHLDGVYGVGENAIVDADINPNPGSTNPFRVGASRTATQRDYRVTLESKVANAATVDPAYKPGYRAPGNTRSVTGLVYQGPWGDPAYPENNAFITKAGLWDAGELWIRYYAPDKSKDALAGVPLPKVTYQLPDGRKYFIGTDLTRMAASANAKGAVPSTAPVEPAAGYGPTVGWLKMWGIIRSGLIGIGKLMYGQGWNDKAYVRAVDKGANGRGEDVPAPGNYEASQTLCNYCHYLQRPMSLGSGKVVTITGRLPTTPKTRNGEATMTAAQLRYFSITTYDQTVTAGGTGDPLTGGGVPFGMVVQSLMDDEIVTDVNGWYTIVLSRPQDRPANATAANGVTWADWGPQSSVNTMIRFLAVGPEWTFPKAPTEVNLGRATDWASPQYNENLIGKNNRTGWLGAYQPIVGYMSPAQFQALGSGWINAQTVPTWR